MVVTQRRRSSLMSESGAAAAASGGPSAAPGEGGARSSDSSGERARGCMHVAKSVDLNKLRKAIKQNGIAASCTQCPPVQQDLGYEEDNSVWVCLNCGSQLCGRMRNKHALKHYETPHSDHHAIAARTRGTSKVYPQKLILPKLLHPKVLPPKLRARTKANRSPDCLRFCNLLLQTSDSLFVRNVR